MPALRTAVTSIVAVSSVLLSSTFAYAAPAVFFDSNLDDGRTNFVNTVNSTVGSGQTTPEIFTFNLATMTDGAGNTRTFTDISSGGTYGRSVLVEGSAGTEVTVNMTSAVNFFTFNSTTGANGYSVSYSGQSLSTWNEIVDEGFNVAFEDTSNNPFLINGIGLEVNDWGTCCTGTNVTSDGTGASGTAVYAVFDPASNPNTLSTDANYSPDDVLQIGSITSSSQRGTFGGSYAGGGTNNNNHFVAAINDTNTWSSAAIVPNGSGEFFGFGGILYFSRVALNSVPAGSSVVTVGSTTRDITQATDVHTALGSTLNYVFDGGTLSVGANLTDAFTIKANGGTVSIASGDDYTMSGILSNASGATGAFAKIGAGTLTLSAANTYTGATTVTAGTLSLTGSLTSDITVAANGTLSGDGSTSGDLTVNGTFAPGDSVGTFSVAGDATIASGGTFSLDIDGRTYDAAGGSGTYDRLAITGASSTFTAGGAIVPITRGITPSGSATNTFTPIIGDAFRVVTTANASGVSGTFASITQPTTGIPTNTRFDVVYGASYVDLVLTPDNLATFVTANGGNQNTVRAATALQTVRPSAVAAKTGNSGAYWTGLYNLNAAQTLNALEQSSGQIHAYSLSAIRSSNVALARFDPAATLRADADEALWVLVGGDWLNFSEDTIASGFDSVSRNVWVGADLHNTGDRRYGVAIGYSDSDVSTDGMGSAQTDTSSIMAYYFGETGNWNYSGLVSMGFSDIKTQRTVDLSTGTTDNASDSSAKTHIARLTVGYSQPVSETVSVGFNADVLRMHTAASGFTETGSAVTGLSATQENQAETQASLSLGLNWAPQNTNTVMGFNAGVEVRPGHDRISDRDVTLHSASWEVETPYMDGQLRFLEAGFRTTVGDLFNTDFEDADAYRINGNVRYTHQGIYERTSLVLGISRAF